MFITNSLSRVFRRLCFVSTGCFILAIALVGQSSQPKPLRPNLQFDRQAAKKALIDLKAGHVDLYGVGLIGMAGMVDAIPYLEKAFPNQSDTLDKARMALVLVQLKDPSDVYWDFLAHEVEHVLSIDAPNPFAFDAQGKMIPGTSPDFLAWAKAHKLDVEAAEVNAWYLYPGEVLYLALTEDPRAVPLLRQALGSRNYFVQANAAQGLAQFQDEAAVPLIIHAAQDAPRDAAELIAMWLVYFDNPDAQKAFDLYVSEEGRQVHRDAKANRTGPIH